MKFLIIFLNLILWESFTSAQYKNLGIKTSQSARNLILQNNNTKTEEINHYNYTNYNGGATGVSGQYIQEGYGTNHHTYSGVVSGQEQQQNQNNRQNGYALTELYGGRFIPAETYQGGPPIVTTTRAPVPLDAVSLFINRTRSEMASGVCHKEVPTASLKSDLDSTLISNGTKPGMSRLQLCCAGYERNPHVYERCDPICENDCHNGICTAPNTCVCIPGHVKGHDNKCISTCPLGCGNGRCNDDGECICHPGYTLDPVTRKFCVPHCERECRFGKCIAPNKCECQEGYHFTAALVCEPSCDNCENGRCTQPGVCVCETGYQKLTGNGTCEPWCPLGCQNGKCAKPDVCECSLGYILDHSGTACIPYCVKPCLNGLCNGPDSCQCNPGYIRDNLDWSKCVPVCNQNCPNGYCSAPNVCMCNPGFTKSGFKGRRNCVQV